MTAEIDVREIKDFLIYLHLKIMSHEEIATGKGLSAMMTLRSRYPQFNDIKSENKKIFEWLDKEAANR